MKIVIFILSFYTIGFCDINNSFREIETLCKKNANYAEAYKICLQNKILDYSISNNINVTYGLSKRIEEKCYLSISCYTKEYERIGARLGISI